MQNHQSLSRIRKIATFVFINVAVTLILLECVLQVVFSIGWDAEQHHKKTSLLIQKIYWTLKPHTSWEEYFIINHANGADLVYANLHQPHATRGWSMIPGAHNENTHINAQGYRALYNYENRPDKYQVLIVGDSFTFGDEIDDEHTWPHLLQAQNDKLNVLNMGGSGYGTDQMLVTLQEEIQHYRPNLVIAAFIDDDLKRAMIPFRDYKKPQFILAHKQLQLTNTPIGDTQQVLKELSHKCFYSYGRIQSLSLFHYLTTDLTLMESEPDASDTTKINTAIFEKMQALANENHADFMLVYLPNGDELSSRDFKSPGETFFYQYIASHTLASLNPRQALLDAPFEKSSGHYKSEENNLLSRLVLEKIKP